MSYIATIHSSFISFNNDNGMLYHGTCPDYFVSHQSENDKIILRFRNGYIGFTEDHNFSFFSDMYAYDTLIHDDGSISITNSGKYLSARPDGSFTWENKPLAYEKFYLENYRCPPTCLEFIDYGNLRRNMPKMIACCCGNNNYGEEWFCTDYNEDKSNHIHKLDITKRFPIDKEKIDFLHVEHGTEHVNLEGLFNFCKEAYRILKKMVYFALQLPHWTIG